MLEARLVSVKQVMLAMPGTSPGNVYKSCYESQGEIDGLGAFLEKKVVTVLKDRSGPSVFFGCHPTQNPKV